MHSKSVLNSMQLLNIYSIYYYIYHILTYTMYFNIFIVYIQRLLHIIDIIRDKGWSVFIFSDVHQSSQTRESTKDRPTFLSFSSSPSYNLCNVSWISDHQSYNINQVNLNISRIKSFSWNKSVEPGFTCLLIWQTDLEVRYNGNWSEIFPLHSNVRVYQKDH